MSTGAGAGVPAGHAGSGAWSDEADVRAAPHGARRRRRTRRHRTLWNGPLGLYASTGSVLHRWPVGPKLALLGACSATVALLRDPRVTAAATLAGLVALGVARVAWRPTVRALLPAVLMAALIGLFQWWRRGPEEAVVVAGGLVCLLLLATAFTATTRTDAVVEAVVRWSAPLRRTGVDPEAVALAVALLLRTVPYLFTLYGEVRDAARSRGLGRSPRALLVPFVLRAVARAHRTGEALAARGLAGPPADHRPGVDGDRPGDGSRRGDRPSDPPRGGRKPGRRRGDLRG